MSPKVHKLPWYTKGLKKLKNLRNKFYKQFKVTGDVHYKILYEHYMREFNFLDKFLYKQYLLNFETSIKNNPKRFWNFIRSKKSSSDYPSVMHYNGKILNSGNDIVNAFSLFFQSNFEVVNDYIDSNVLKFIQPIIDFGCVQLTTGDILNSIKNIKNSFGIDIDGFSSFFIKNLAESLTIPLQYLFNKSLAEGHFIDRWKVASITPVFKGGDKTDVINYRPISKLSNISKIFEHVIKEKMFFSIKHYICDEQHGFFPGRSTATNCAVFNHFCISVFEKHNQVDAIFMDLCKAFDKVAHNILCLKLCRIGFYGTFLDWLRSYLSDRKYTVVMENFMSCTYTATSGVPQGSILGPLLFLIFINDIGNYCSGSQFLLYADDLKIFKEISSDNDACILQLCINKISSWCNINNLPLNVNKCCQMSFRKPNICNVKTIQYKLFGNNLKVVNQMLDLGIILDCELNFNAHLDYIIPKAYSACAFIRRNCQDFSDPLTLRILYTAFGRSKLEYCSFIWNPIYNVHTNRIERVQKKFVKYALRNDQTMLMTTSYNARCLLLGLKPLCVRRTINSTMIIYNLINGYIDCEYLLKLIKFCIPFKHLRSNNLFYVSTRGTNYAMREPLLRALNTLNNINNIVSIDFSLSVNDFKLLLENKDLLHVLFN